MTWKNFIKAIKIGFKRFCPLGTCAMSIFLSYWPKKFLSTLAKSENKIISCCFIDFLTAAVHKTRTRLKIHVSSIFSASLALTSVIKSRNNIAKKYYSSEMTFEVSFNSALSITQSTCFPKLISRFLYVMNFYFFIICYAVKVFLFEKELVKIL